VLLAHIHLREQFAGTSISLYGIFLLPDVRTPGRCVCQHLFVLHADGSLAQAHSLQGQSYSQSLILAGRPRGYDSNYLVHAMNEGETPIDRAVTRPDESH